MRWTALPRSARRDVVRPAVMRMLWMMAASGASVASTSNSADAQVTLRGQQDPIAGDVTKVGPEGITITIGGVPKIVGWDRVREVHGEQGAAATKQLEAVADLWRARMRLERGDFPAAEPMLDALAAKERGMFGPTAAVVFEGQLRCRLKRGATLPAVWAWLDWVQARGGAIGAGSDTTLGWIGGRFDAPAVVESRTGLILSTPPIFLHDAALDAAVASDEWSRYSSADTTTAELAMLYRAAARFEAELSPELGPVTSNNEAVRLVADIVQARVGNDQQRQAGRANLKSRLEQRDIDPWTECWCRMAMGRSLLREPDSDMMRQGIIQLLHVPSRFARGSSYIAPIALAEAAVMLHELGDEAGAAALKAELLDRYPRSNASGWARLREIKPILDPRKQNTAKEPAAPATKDATGKPPEGNGG